MDVCRMRVQDMRRNSGVGFIRGMGVVEWLFFPKFFSECKGLNGVV
jgi:hypothetical protein